MLTIIIFIIVLAMLIFVHELGHFLVARMFGIRVDEFALGFGPKLWSKIVVSPKHGETKYAINLIPFGGYVKIFGENPDAESISGPDNSRSFVNKARPKQIMVLVAGVFFNFAFAVLLFSIAFMAGFPVSTTSYPEYADRVEERSVVVTSVDKSSPAGKAGVLVGDRLLLDSVEAVQTLVGSSDGKSVRLEVLRGTSDEKVILDIVPIYGIIQDKYAIGIMMENSGLLKLPVHLAIYEGTRYTWHIIKETIFGVWDLMARSVTGKASLDSVSGPIGIAGVVGDAARLGFIYLVIFTALISVNLGVLNLVPFPALDGGRILFVLVESIIRRPIKPAIQNTANAIGFLLLITLMIVVTYHDIVVKWF